MKSSCISHPEREPLVQFKRWQVVFCEGNTCAAALMNYFEYWHNNRLDNQYKAKISNDIAETHGDKRTQSESLLQFHTLEALYDGLLGAFGHSKIRESIAFLADKKVISIFNNPNPRYSYDKTKHYFFHPEICYDFLATYQPKDKKAISKSRPLKTENASVENNISTVENNRQSVEIEGSTVENNSAIQKITSKITEKEIAAELESDRDVGINILASDHIGDELTESQSQKIKHEISCLSEDLKCEPESLYHSIRETLLNPACYSKTQNKFTYKLNTIFKAIRQGKYFSSKQVPPLTTSAEMNPDAQALAKIKTDLSQVQYELEHYTMAAKENTQSDMEEYYAIMIEHYESKRQELECALHAMQQRNTASDINITV